MSALLEVRDLSVRFGRHRTLAVDRVSLTLDEGDRLGLVGESGSGKSVTALAVLGLLPETATVTGSVRWQGREILGLPDRELAKLRGQEFSMVFQEPMTALDPLMKAGRQVAEVLGLHRGMARGASRPLVLEMLAAVGLADPVRIADSYPHQLSGGQRQRVLMAMALVNRPDLVVCDEPTTALDVTVQARVLATLDERLDDAGAACLFISHDLAVVSQVCARVAVLRHGRLVEQGTTAQVLGAPQRPYTRGLVAVASLEHAEPGSRLPLVDDFARDGGAS
ncbi:ATP-binding cassette domain-containing protein [Aestuariimicrobium ganziense]|uniref:ATP-binding cassette domain-containing protein n=1 Tax=Aestuariimicrobium ganziense TaxID=2773677 RepID=UPI0019425F4C|nr:ABC transporter ATP-binding protein [Aestuariimicrobium ganziense]